ncbi:porin [Phaeobacter inhibens]|uniref:porin n=1 Tax=Phaeobacter inhibens TaxID=221822 RepID=UPI000C9B9F6F|nr:porin [Phaeobacter inhibens]AUQ67969.1 porin [Phaeobacter inhibens]UWR88266.1 porin [Phaeobacter inhibens]
MKKILFASTALVATAGVAAADVSFGGYGRFGVGYMEDRELNSSTDPADLVAGSPDTIIVSRFRLNIDASAETDAGVKFSARVRLQADEDSNNGEANAAGLNGARFSVEYGGLRVDVGNVAGAIDNLPNYYGNEPGLENFTGQYSGNDYSFVGYSSGGAGVNGVYARYAVGDFAVAASYDQSAPGTDADRWDIHAAYTFGNITAALAYGETDAGAGSDLDMTVLTLGGTWGAFSGTLIVGDESTGTVATSDTFYGVSAAYDVSSATTLTFAYGDGSGDGDTRNVGIGAIHDLGGGVSLRGGIGEIKRGNADGFMRADFGAQFSF